MALTNVDKTFRNLSPTGASQPFNLMDIFQLAVDERRACEQQMETLKKSRAQYDKNEHKILLKRLSNNLKMYDKATHVLGEAMSKDVDTILLDVRQDVWKQLVNMKPAV